MKLKLVMLVSVFAFGLAFSANAGSVSDADGDLVPDQFDNCVTTDNGPNEQSNQVDTDLDGYGNACDADYSLDNTGAPSGAADFLITTGDFPTFVAAFTGTQPNLETDHTGDTLTTTADFAPFLAMFQGTATLGPGLSCAGVSVPCLP